MKKTNNNWIKVKDLDLGMKIAVPKNRALDLHWKNSALAEQGTEKGAGDILWDEIVEIKKVGKERVYDIEVEGTHNFVAGHLINQKTKQALTPEQEEKYLAKFPISKFQFPIY